MAVEAEYLNAIYNNYLPLSPGLTYLFPYDELHNRYAQSIYGQHHAEQPLRYAQSYGYEPRETMLADLGDDVHPVRHMYYTEGAIVKPLMEAQNLHGDEKFNIEQISALRIGAHTHDIGECTHQKILEITGHSVGDVAWDLKTADDGDKERVIRQYLYKILYPDLPQELLDRADDIIDNRSGSFTREAFFVAERIGYYKTALKAGELALRLHSEREEKDEQRYTQLGRLAFTVTNNHREFLQSESERFVYTQTILEGGARLDEEVQTTLGYLVTVPIIIEK